MPIWETEWSPPMLIERESARAYQPFFDYLTGALAEVSVDLLCQQIRGSYTAARYRACLPRVPRFLCTGHRKRPHLYSQVCRWLGMPAPGLQEPPLAS